MAQITASASTEDKIRFKAYWVSLIGSVIMLGMKLVAYHITGSQAIFSDALESIINVITPIVGLFVIWISSKPADKEHPYGHGKIEYFSSAFEGGLILFAAVMILLGAAKSFVRGAEIRELDFGLAFITGAGLLNLFLGFFVLRIGEKYHSSALKANGKHILSDVWTTVGVIVGLFLVRFTGVKWLDPVAAIFVGSLLAIDGFRLVRESAGSLMDEEDLSLLEVVAGLFTKHRTSGIIHIHHTRMVRSGRYHHIDAHVVVPEFWNIADAHDRTVEFEGLVIKDYPVEGEVHFHLDPCRRAYCRACDLKDCPIRREPFKEALPFTVDSLINPEEPEEYHPK